MSHMHGLAQITTQWLSSMQVHEHKVHENYFNFLTAPIPSRNCLFSFTDVWPHKESALFEVASKVLSLVPSCLTDFSQLEDSGVRPRRARGSLVLEGRDSPLGKQNPILAATGQGRSWPRAWSNKTEEYPRAFLHGKNYLLKGALLQNSEAGKGHEPSGLHSTFFASPYFSHCTIITSHRFCSQSF